MSCVYCKHVLVLVSVLIVCCSSASLGASISISDDSISIESLHELGYFGEPSVHHFARHALCRNVSGKIRFYNALTKHLCEISANMKVSLVIDLCERKDYMLDKWVAEIYDTDGDGYISHHERSYFND